MSIVLRSLTIGDEPAALEACGFRLDDHDVATVDGVRLHAAGAAGGRGIVRWGLEGLPEQLADLDGIPTAVERNAEPPPEPAIDHPSTALAIDHVVVRTPDLPRTLAALAAAGFELRRTRDVGNGAQQAFFVLGTAVLEVVGPTVAAGEGPASLWGITFVVADPVVASEVLGEGLGAWKPAVQPGRSIATLRHEVTGSSVPFACMTPRV